ncbi:hypothetical protein TESG_07483 [Trichophyton tonsurans CBS 112818]|uniref:C-CAP/cofactor C-like domain-containing protein n=1 Tax=Trichophyton tonsurans (strain CBS 112818) TaxID=647933 RepID=F2S9B3_TRIT1|nr:hypothetical protein TESG_07483 [Trichophyton tonsurans CBS 112818]
MLSKDMEEGCLVQDAGGDATGRKPEQSTNDKFFRYFQEEVTKVEERITKLHTTPIAGGEQASAADYCLADISRLSDEVKDASTYIPSYDQRAYASAIKALQEKFADAKEAITPRKRFAFKRSRQPTPVQNTTDEVMQDTPTMPQTTAPNPSPELTTRVALVSHEKVTDNMEPEPSTAVDEGKKETQQEEQAVKEQEQQQQEEGEERLQPQRSEPQLPAAQVISFKDVENSHVTLSDSAPLRNASLSVNSVQKSVIDMSSVPELGRSFSTCIFRDSYDSLAILGKVDGPAFISDVIDSVVVVTCHQFRMHDCNNVVVYLSCATNPIIEGCVGIKFSPLPEAFSAQNGKQADKWSLVEDFNWLKSEPSPNWGVLEDENTVEDHVWGRILGDKHGMQLTEILERTGVTSLTD